MYRWQSAASPIAKAPDLPRSSPPYHPLAGSRRLGAHESSALIPKTDCSRQVPCQRLHNAYVGGLLSAESGRSGATVEPLKLTTVVEVRVRERA